MKYLMTLFTCSAAAFTIALNYYDTTALKIANIVNIVILFGLVIKEVSTWEKPTRKQ